MDPPAVPDITMAPLQNENCLSGAAGPPLLHIGDENLGSDISEELMSVIEVISITGKYWHDWDVLRSLLSIRLKQVLAQYPETEITSESGPYRGPVVVEKHSELVERLNADLLSFVDGPPFTLQRLCEILLTPKEIYPCLSKLALALEKNLLVTSTFAISTDPYLPLDMLKSTQINKQEKEQVLKPDGESKSIKPEDENLGGNSDVEMMDAEQQITETRAEAQEEKENQPVADSLEADQPDSNLLSTIVEPRSNL